MPLTNVQIQPGFNKQVTPTGAEGQWTDGDFVRFRYGLPEKIGGWEQILSGTLVGAAREQFVWADLDGRRYAAIGTNKILAVYYEGAFYDITPLATALTGCTFDTVNTSATVTVNKAAHGLEEGDLFTFTSVTPPSGAGYTAADFTTNTFQVITVPSTNEFTITMASNAGTTVNGSGSATVNPYEKVGSLAQNYGFGWGTALWGGGQQVISTLNGALLDDTAGTGGSGTSITLADTTGFPTSGTIKVGAEFISYTGVSSNDLTGITRATAGTRSAHSDGAGVEYFTGWGDASLSQTLTIDPASWSLDNFGEQLIATIKNGRSFSWNPINSNSNALTTRATVISNAPTASVMSLVSDRDRHLFMLGTEETIGSAGSQDKMFIRFSDQEDITDYTATSVNTAGTFRLDSGTKIVGAVKGKDYTFVLTDTSAYVIQFVGPPFTFSVRQVGSNCGAIGQHSIKYVNGAIYWIGESGGFFVYDGTVKALPCLVEDFVFKTTGTNLGINYDQGEAVYAGLNHLYEEITWFYAKNGSSVIDRCVTYNYQNGTWTTGSLARTTWVDASLYDVPYATEFKSNDVPTFPTIQGVTNINGATIYYAHEVGVNQVDSAGVKTAIPAFIQSGDFDLSQGGDGQFFMSIRRFIPDFKVLTGDAQITINLRRFPTDTATSSPLGPFTITSSTEKVDTRARSRFASIKVANTSTDQSWRYGTFRADVQPDGMR
mgnify:FL=1|jgi:hypothetical protein|tara:strand:- start:643 stop:2793 length:2151 start_codon:yes stop_codon:yes gene_type:complete